MSGLPFVSPWYTPLDSLESPQPPKHQRHPANTQIPNTSDPKIEPPELPSSGGGGGRSNGAGGGDCATQAFAKQTSPGQHASPVRAVRNTSLLSIGSESPMYLWIMSMISLDNQDDRLSAIGDEDEQCSPCDWHTGGGGGGGDLDRSSSTDDMASAQLSKRCTFPRIPSIDELPGKTPTRPAQPACSESSTPRFAGTWSAGYRGIQRKMSNAQDLVGGCCLREMVFPSMAVIATAEEITPQMPSPP